MEIILFAVLAGYLFFRLWSVLGTRTGQEKPMDPSRNAFFESQEKDNIIVMPKQAIRSSLAEEQESLLTNQLKELKAVMPDFDLKSFVPAAEKAFILIIKSYSQGNTKALKGLLDNLVYQQFCTAIKDRTDKNLRQETEIDTVQGEVIATEIVSNKAQVTVRFKSDQVLVTFDQNNEIIDNPARFKTPVNDVWTFEKSLNSKNPTWLLIRTSADTTT
jgi:predicted lipid-binding transport protein (Tim44 family)